MNKYSKIIGASILGYAALTTASFYGEHREHKRVLRMLEANNTNTMRYDLDEKGRIHAYIPTKEDEESKVMHDVIYANPDAKEWSYTYNGKEYSIHTETKPSKAEEIFAKTKDLCKEIMHKELCFLKKTEEKMNCIIKAAINA